MGTRRGETTGAFASEADLSALEREVDRVAGLALGAHGLAERGARCPVHERAPGWEERSAVLRWAVDAAQQRLRDLAG